MAVTRTDPDCWTEGWASRNYPLRWVILRERLFAEVKLFPSGQLIARPAALLPLLKGLNITSDLIDVRKVVTGQQSQNHTQGFRAALIVLASAPQSLR